MLFFSFKNYEEFNEIFGIVEHGNGVKSRKNKILLALYKDKQFFKFHVQYLSFMTDKRLRDHFHIRYSETTCNSAAERIAQRIFDFYDEKVHNASIDSKIGLLRYTNLIDLKNRLYSIMQNSGLTKPECCFDVRLGDKLYFSDIYETDDMNGLCEDGTLNAIRYRNIEKNRTFKMKAGRMLNHLISRNKVVSTMPEEIKRWFSEEFVADWVEYSREHIKETEYTLHVDDNFRDIYCSDCCAGYDEDSDAFGSCMVDDDQWQFYRHSVKAKAAYLTDSDDMIVARCIIYSEVFDENDKVWRLAERQYSKFSDLSLQRQLVLALIRDGHIDGYKRVGASCHAPRDFVDNEGNSLQDKRFRIKCKLHNGDVLSYQDSFKYYSVEEEIADNYGHREELLSTTEGEFSYDEHEHEYWSAYNECYISEDEAIWVESRNDYFREDQVHYAYTEAHCHYQEYCFEDDCVEIDGDYIYAGDNCEEYEAHGISKCPECGFYFIAREGNAAYSELTGEDYCDDNCLDNAESRWHRDNGDVFSTYDDTWYGEEEVITAMLWDEFLGGYSNTIISIESFNELVEDGEATVFCGDYFVDQIQNDGEPLHLLRIERVTA